MNRTLGYALGGALGTYLLGRQLPGGTDAVSSLLWGSALGTAAAGLTGPGLASVAPAPSVLLLSAVAYDRYHDGMWPFYDEERHLAAFGSST